MPNHVYNTMVFKNENLTSKISEVIKLENGGLAQYVMPMPDEIRNTISPTYIAKDGDNSSDNPQVITQAEHDRLMKDYGAVNWYDWACNNWGTKWGTYDHYWDEGTSTLTFSTAWSLLSVEVLSLIAKNFGDYELHAVEESGEFDTIIEAKNGTVE